MKVLLATAAAVVALVSVPASATTFLINGGLAITPPSGYNQNEDFTTTLGGSTGAYTSYYNFNLGTSMTLSFASFTNSGDTADYATNAARIFKVSSAANYCTTAACSGGTFMSGSGAVNSTGGTFNENFGLMGTLQSGFYTVVVQGTIKNTTGNLSSNFTFAAPSVPEPATWGMMVLGFGVVGGALRTSRRKVIFA